MNDHLLSRYLRVIPNRSELRLGCLASLLLATSLGGACSDPEAEALLEGQDCLVIVLDSLAAGHLGCYGGRDQVSPAIDSLAQGGVRFGRAWSQTSWTLSSTACLMTGQYQETHGVHSPDQALPLAAETLAEAFVRKNYDCIGLTQNLFASPQYGFGQGFGRYDILMRKGDYQGVMATHVIEALADQGSRKPRFVYAHFRRPHSPYDPAEQYVEQFTSENYAGPIIGSNDDVDGHNKGKLLNPEDLGHLEGLYHAGIRAVDDEIREILSTIDTSKTLVVLLSDHGEAFNEHGLLGHNFNSYEEMVHIPMILAHPSLSSGSVVETPAMSIDILPTLAELFDLSVGGANLPGRSLLPELTAGQGEEQSESRLVFSSSRLKGDLQKFAASDGRYKLVVDPRAKKRYLFDLALDPIEARDISSAKPQVASTLREALSEWQNSQEMETQVPAGELKKMDEEAMKALGYFGD